MPSDKHMAKGVEVFEATCRDMTRDPAEIIAEALANAEREGMKRAADIALWMPFTHNVRSVLALDVLTGAARLILSEAGEKA